MPPIKFLKLYVKKHAVLVYKELGKDKRDVAWRRSCSIYFNKSYVNIILAAIPLVDPEFKLLQIHYNIDPGEAFVWKNVGNPVVCKQYERSYEQKLNLIRR